MLIASVLSSLWSPAPLRAQPDIQITRVTENTDGLLDQSSGSFNDIMDGSSLKFQNK